MVHTIFLLNINCQLFFQAVNNGCNVDGIEIKVGIVQACLFCVCKKRQ